ncbi:MAG: hypothetical protein EA443_00920 [Nitrosopumilus sp.]|nr:MAG: hypothetical protein EA443_00920 [Nitrosopumilus sp.]
MYFEGFIFFHRLIDCDGRMANAIRTGVTVLDFRHVAHHSLFAKGLESNIFNAEGLVVSHDYNRSQSQNQCTNRKSVESSFRY